MASAEFLNKAYLAYFGRPVDPVGLMAFANATEQEVYEAFYASPESRALYGSSFGAEQINAIYNMLFGRDAEPAGLEYWLHQIELGYVTPAGAALSILNGALNEDKVAIQNKLAASAAFTASLDTLDEASAYVGDAAAQYAREWLKTIETFPASQNQVDDVIVELVDIYGPGVRGPADVYTLTEVYTETTVTSGPQLERVVMWGYNPHAHDETSGVDNLDGNNPDGNDNNLTNEGPEDGGVPIEILFQYIQTVADLDLVQLGLINVANGEDDESTQLFGDVTGMDIVNNGDGTQTITVTLADGTVNTAEVAISQQFFDMIHNWLFDAEGNSRLYEVVRAVDPNDTGSSTTVRTYEPIVLTTYDNNGGTVEDGVVTGPNDDRIVAGRLELLHGAYIDAGAGYNTLEVDAKGTYAQPKLLENIQKIVVQNMPNVYTVPYGSGDGYLSNSTYPDLSSSGGSNDSVLDVTRAVDLERLVITEVLDTGRELGELTVVGVRGNAVVRFEGGFDRDITVNYGEGQNGSVDIELAIGDIDADINLLHNAAVINVDSQGIDNHMHNFFAGGTISRMVVEGTGYFAVEENMSGSFNSSSPAIIDASANTGGVDLTLNGHYNLTVTGTAASDEINATGSTKVVVDAGNGNNVVNVDGSATAIVTAGTGNDKISAQNGTTVTIDAGEGNNSIDADSGSKVSITAGDGNNQITAESASQSVTVSVGDGANSIDVDGSKNVTITAGDGGNTVSAVNTTAVGVTTGAGNDTVVASAQTITIDSTAGDDVVTIAGTGGDLSATAAAGLNLMLILDDSGSMSGTRITALQSGLNQMLDGLEASGVNTATISVVFTSSATASAWGTISDARDVIDSLQASGGTNYEAALEAAMTGWATPGKIVGANNVSIFVSDATDTITNAAAWEDFLVDNAVKSYAVGLDVSSDTGLADVAYDGQADSDLAAILTDATGLAHVLDDIGTTIVGTAGKQALVNIDLGEGQNTLHLGDADQLSQGLVALEGSSITGENITMVVNADSDVRAAELSGITRVVLDNGDVGSADRSVDNAILTLTASQFKAIGAANFSVEGSIFHTHAYIKVIVDEDTSLTDLGVDSLPRNIDLHLEINDGVTLTTTAEQLHTKVAQNGITLADDGNTDVVAGKVVITGGGLDFDPFNTSDTVKTNIGGNIYYGGSLSDDFMVNGVWYNVSVQSLVNGWDRPADVSAEVVITLDSGTGLGEISQGAFSTWHTNLEILGEKDIAFTGAVQMGMLSGVPTNPFTIDFSQLDAEVRDFTVDNFELLGQGGGIHGNADKGYDSVVHVQLAADEGVQGTAAVNAADNSVGFDEGDDAQSLVSSGVSKYIVTVIDGPTANGSDGNQATIKLCDTTQDLEVLALRGNYNDTLNVIDAAWGLVFELQGGTTAKADGPTGTANVGKLTANYEWDGADAEVNLVHSVAGDTRTIKAYGIDIDNADSITINSMEGNAIVDAVSGGSLDELFVNAAGNVAITATLQTLDVIDASGVTGTFSASVDQVVDGYIPITGIKTDGVAAVAAVTGQLESTTYTFTEAMQAGESLTINGVTVTATADATATEIAAAFRAPGSAHTGLTVTGSYATPTGWTGTPVVAGSGTELTLTNTVTGNVTDLSGSTASGYIAITGTKTDGVNAVAAVTAVKESTTYTITEPMQAGDNLTISGLTVTATGDATVLDIANAFRNPTGTYSNLTVTGTLVTPNDWAGIPVSSGSGATFTLTNTVDGPVTDLTAPSSTNAPSVSTDFTFIGADGGSTLTFTDSFTATSATSIDGGAGEVTLVVAAGKTVDLDAASLSDVGSVVLNQGAKIVLTVAQAVEIGEANFSTPGSETATIELSGLDGEPFVMPDFASDITVSVVSVKADPLVELHPTTNLTGIGALNVVEGTTLTLSLKQFQQLNDAGTISVIDGADAGSVVEPGKVTINITGVTQADIGTALSFANIVAGTTLNLQLAESVDLSGATLTGVNSITFGANQTLTLGDITQANGVAIVGGTNSTLIFKDLSTNPFESIDASGFDVTYLKHTNTLTADGNRNIDDIFSGLAESITKVVYNGEGWVNAVDQTVVIEAGTTVFDSLVYNKVEANVELQDFTINLLGGVELDGHLRLSTNDKFADTDADGVMDSGEKYLIRDYLQTLTINSTGTAGNLLSGKTANIINQDVTPMGVSGVSEANNLLDVTINATQDLIIKGKLVFNSVVGNDNGGDGMSVNDQKDVTAKLTVNGTADVNVGTIDTSDDDVDGLDVVNNGTGTLSVTVNAANIDTADLLSFTGTGDIALTVVGNVDLSGDVLTAVSSITIADGTSAEALTLSQAQFNALGAANIIFGGTGNDLDDTQTTLNINGVNAVFDATTIDKDINVGTLTLAGSMDFAATASNLTGVDSIVVPKGAVLTLTAAQYQQLLNAGTITGLDANGAATSDYTVHITNLTQADIDAGEFVTTGITAATITLALGGDVNLSADDVIENVDSLIMADGQTLGLKTHAQADDLVINGGADTTVNFLFDINFAVDGEIEAAGYNVTTLRALAVSVDNQDVEVLIDNLPNSVTLNLYEDPAQVGYVSDIHRVVVIEPGVQVPTGYVAFNASDANREVRTLKITFQGDGSDPITDANGNIFGAVINGNLVLDAYTPANGSIADKFNKLTLVSEGTGNSNAITGNITPLDTDGAGAKIDNNLLNVEIQADSAFRVGGSIVFNSTAAALDTATLTVNGAAPVTIQQVTVNGSNVDTLTIDNDGGALTITGASPSINAGSAEAIVLQGDGNITLGTVETTQDYADGIAGTALSSVDASGLSGDLYIENISGVDQNLFSFTAGTGVTNVTMSGQTLDADVSPATTSGWTFDLSDAAAGSALHLRGNTYTDGSLNIDLGANATLYIDADTNLSTMDLSIIQTLPIVLADGVTLTLTAEQADDLVIIAGPDTGTAGISAKVNIVNLTNDTDPDNPVDAIDLSGIAQNIAGTITFKAGVNDVTLDKATDLGHFSVTLDTIADDSTTLQGQTIRFQNVDQAERKVIAANDVTPLTGSSTNVVWLFDSVSAPVNTNDYASNLGRLWINQTLANGANVEDLFTTLPNSIVRVEFSSIEFLDAALTSADVNRVVELVAHTDLPAGLVFSDSDRLEHLNTLTLQLGGEVNVGSLNLDNIVVPAANVGGISFDKLTINSYRALHQDHFLAPELYVNDNDGVNEAGEYVAPANLNVIGDVSIGANNGLDLLNVVLNTGDVSSVGNTTNNDAANLALSKGANLQIGTITFDAETAGSDALLTVIGANTTTIASLNVTDAQIDQLTITNSGSGALVITGASPAASLGNNPAVANVETLVINTVTTGTAGSITLGTAADATKPGVSGDDLSLIDVNGNGNVNLGVIALVDGAAPVSPATRSFYLDATGNSGIVTATLGGSATLAAGGVWEFANGTGGSAGTLALTITDQVTFGAGKLTISNAAVTIQGNVDFTTLTKDNLLTVADEEGLVLTSTTIHVPAGSTLKILAEDANGLTITGAGAVTIEDLELTPGADLSKIMTNAGDTGTVVAIVDTSDSVLDPDALPQTITLTSSAKLGIAEVQVIGGGTLDATEVTVANMQASIDRAPVGDAASNDVTLLASFTVAAGTKLVLTAAQGDDRSVTGAGTTDVEDIGLYAGGTNVDMSLAGVNSAFVNIAVGTNATLNSLDDLGAAGANRVTTIAPTATLTAAGSVVDGQYITSNMATVANTNATLVVDDENDANGTTILVDTPITADLSHVSVEYISLVSTALVGAITWPALTGNPVDKYIDDSSTVAVNDPNANVYVQTVTLTAAQASGQTILGANAGTEGQVIVNALGAGFTDLSNIDVGRATANVPADATLHAGTDLGEFAVVLNGVDVDLTLSAAQADGRTITDTGTDGDSVTVTALEATPNADLSAIVVDTETALLDANGGVTLGANLGSGFEVIVSDSVAGGSDVVIFDTNTGQMVSAATTFTIASDDITLVFDANNAHDLTVAEAVEGVPVDQLNSAVIVNNVDGDEMDLTGIVADTMTANVPADATMHAATDFGGFVVRLAEGADLTLSYTQFLNVAGNGALAAGDFDSAAGGVEELVTVTDWNPSAALDTSVVLPNLALVLEVDAALGATQTVHAATNLTGVEEIVIPTGVTLTMTASQFQQIQTSATVTGDGTLNLTGFDQDNYLIDLSTVTANAGTISLDPTKGATQIVGGQVQWVTVANKIVLDPAAVLDNATGDMFAIVMTANNQGITLSSETQADGRSVSEGNQPAGYTDTRLILGFDSPDAADGDSNLVATNFKVDNVIALNTYLSNQFGGVTPANIETFLFDLDSGIPVTIFDADSALVANVVTPSAVASVNRTVTVEPNTFVDASIAFNDLRPDSEVRTLVLNLNGNAIIDGNLTLPQNQDPRAQLPTSYVQLFDSLTINSTDAVGTLVSPNELRGNIIANTALNGAESQVEVFTLTLDAAMTIVGSEDQIGFDGGVINLADGSDVDTVGAAIAAGSYNNWRATYDAPTNVVTFTNITAGTTTDVAIGNFTFVQNGASTNYPGTSAVAVTQQGSFAAGENNLLDVTINATHDLNITGELEFSYVSGTSSILNTTVDETAEADLTITVAAGITVNIGSVDTSDDHITALNYVKNGLGTVNAPGTSPGASVGDTETLRITQVGGGTTTFGTAGNLDRPGVAGDDLSLIDVNGLGTVDLGVIALVDADLFELNTDGMGAASVVNATLRADMAAGGAWTFDNSAGLGDLNLTIAGTGVADTYGVDPAYGAAFGAGGTLTFDNVNLLLEGAVDLSGVTLNLTATTISVLAGGTLTLTVQQVLALQAANVDVTGEGTVAVIGDATDVNAANLGEPLRTVGVDLSAITLDTTPPAPVDADSQLDIVLLGALVDDGNTLNGYSPVVAAGQDIIGSDNDDDITASAQNDTLTGGLGNDTLRGNGGDDTYNVDAGTDTIIGLNNGDVLVVSAGATTNPDVATGFTATADSSNDGTVALTDTDNNGDTTIDMSLAGGTNGFTITGGTGAALGTDRLTGSDNVDVINGGNTTQTAAAAKDILTGGLDADEFVFNLTLSSAATLTTTTTQAAIDREIITFTADDTDEGTESISVAYTLNGINQTALIDLAGVAVTNQAAIVAEAIAVLDARAGISATAGANPGEVVITGDSGGSVTIGLITVQDGDESIPGDAEPVVDGLGAVASNGTDQAQITTITVAGTPTAGDYYSVLVDYYEGTGTSDDYTAVGGDDAIDIAEGLDDLGSEAVVTAENGGTAVITLTAVSADAGGFSVVTDTTAAFAGSGASDNGAGNYLTADVITDFTTAEDTISFGLAAGQNGVNYLEAAGVATYALARTAADAAFDGTVQYYLTSATDFDGAGGSGQVEGQEGGGLLFFDANLDGNVDGVVILLGVTNTTFHANDIVA